METTPSLTGGVRKRTSTEKGGSMKGETVRPNKNPDLDLGQKSGEAREGPNVGPKRGRKRVLVVGSGAAGTAAAWSFTRHPDKFDVEIWEKNKVPGGVAVSSVIPGDLNINYGVQGGTPTYRNTLNLLKTFDITTSPIHMMISFGKGPTAWNNYKKTPLIEKLGPEIARFEGVLKTISRLELFFIFVPIAKVLKWYNFSDDFRNEMVFPLTALFFGTGNQTPNVSAAIVARVFLDDDLRLFQYDPERLLSQTPEMFAFPNLQNMYTTIVTQAGIAFFPCRTVDKVVRRDRRVYVTDTGGAEETFDELVFACDAETALKVLDKPTFWEKKALGNVTYFNDLIITHEDEEYMNKYYEVDKNTDQYFVRTDPDDQEKIEMSFNLSNYQPTLQDSGRNIYQTIYLDDKLKDDTWTDQEVADEKVLLRTWWRQFAHTWRHFAFTTPFVRYIQGVNNTWYCGAYTLINTHEIAVISGLAVAHRLGAPYPFPEDQLAAKQFDQYLLVIHGESRERGCNCQRLKSLCLAPLARIFSCCLLMVGCCCCKPSD